MKKRLEDMTEPEIRCAMQRCAEAVMGVLRREIVPASEKPQFVLVVFDDPKVAQYISSCTRESMIAAMRETADRLERREDVPRT